MKTTTLLMAIAATLATPALCLAQPSKPIVQAQVHRLTRPAATVSPAANYEQARKAQLVLTVLYLAGATQQRAH